jgi:hypothetical protein
LSRQRRQHQRGKKLRPTKLKLAQNRKLNLQAIVVSHDA